MSKVPAFILIRDRLTAPVKLAALLQARGCRPILVDKGCIGPVTQKWLRSGAYPLAPADWDIANVNQSLEPDDNYFIVVAQTVSLEATPADFVTKMISTLSDDSTIQSVKLHSPGTTTLQLYDRNRLTVPDTTTLPAPYSVIIDNSTDGEWLDVRELRLQNKFSEAYRLATELLQTDHSSKVHYHLLDDLYVCAWETNRRGQCRTLVDEFTTWMSDQEFAAAVTADAKRILGNFDFLFPTIKGDRTVVYQSDSTGSADEIAVIEGPVTAASFPTANPIIRPLHLTAGLGLVSRNVPAEPLVSSVMATGTDIAIYNTCDSFDEYLDPLASELRKRGYSVVITREIIQNPAVFHFMFGLNNAGTSLPLGKFIAVQLEQITSQWISPDYLDRLRHAVEVWEFSRTSVPILRLLGINAVHVPLGKSETTIPPLNEQGEDIDVLFFGSLNERRQAIIEGLRDYGISVHLAQGVFGATKDALIDRSKIVLNLHYYDKASDEQLRIIPALMRVKLVVSEEGADRLPYAEVCTGTSALALACRKWLTASASQRRERALKYLERVPNFADVVPWKQLAIRILDNLYTYKWSTKADINEHLPVLYSLAQECTSIAEFGVRSIVSSWALLTGLATNKRNLPGKYLGADLNTPGQIEQVKLLAREAKVDFSFVAGDDLQIKMPFDVDLLFIDTLHNYSHLTMEFRVLAPHAKRWIVMHDSSHPFELEDEFPVDWSRYPADVDRNKRGLWPAITDFLESHPEWRLLHRYVNNHGLTVLERI